MCAFDLPTKEIRNAFLKKCYDEGLLMLGCGVSSVRFRPPLVITRDEIDTGMGLVEKVLKNL